MSNPVKTLLEIMLKGTQGDVCVVGSDEKAKQVREALVELCRDDITVIADDKISSNSLWITSMEALGQMPYGGQN